MKSNDELTAERPQQTRASLSGTVSVRLPEQKVVGRGDSGSAVVASFGAAASLRVVVPLPRDGWPRLGAPAPVSRTTGSVNGCSSPARKGATNSLPSSARARGEAG